MGPTVFKVQGLRFFFFSREETRPHVHVQAATGEAKFWIDPQVTVAENHGLSLRLLNKAARLVTEHEDEIRRAWKEHFEC